MASTVTVFETAARRTVVKVTPGKYLHEVRAEACKKFNLDPDRYGLKHNGKAIDLSTNIRLTGLAAGAKLELTLLSRSAGVVTIALQLPEPDSQGEPNGRLIDKFASTTTLWQILRKFEDGVAGTTQKRNITARGVPKIAAGDAGAGRLYYEQPVVNVMGREMGSFVDLQKTLSALGLNGGNVVLRLGFRTSDQPFEEAQAHIGRYFDDVEGSRRELETTEQSETTSAPTFESSQHQAHADYSTQTEPSTEPLISSASAEDPAPDTSLDEVASTTIAGVSERPLQVFSAPSGITPKAAMIEHDPADYEFTVDHAKIQAAQYHAAGRNKPLPSDAEIEAAKQAAIEKAARVQSVNIKVRFPDETTVVSKFEQADTGKTLYDWVRSLMQHGDASFVLRWPGKKGMEDVPSGEKKLIQDIGMAGGVTVTLTWKPGVSEDVRRSPTLKKQVNQQAREIQVIQPQSEVSSAPKTLAQERVDQSPGERMKGLPAWLKKSLPGKK